MVSWAMRAPRLLVRVEVGAYHYVVLPLVARLPPRVAYGLGRIAGDLQYGVESSKRKMTLVCLERALGDRLGASGRVRVAHECFRLWACDEIDRLRLSGTGQLLAKLVEIDRKSVV